MDNGTADVCVATQLLRTHEGKQAAPGANPRARPTSMVRCTRRRWLAAERLACRLMPVEAASLMTATSFLPAMKRSRSLTAGGV